MNTDANDVETIKEYLTLPDLNQTGVGMIDGGSLSPLLAAVYLHPLDLLMKDLRRHKKMFITHAIWMIM